MRNNAKKNMQGTSLLLQPSSQNMIECSGRKLSNSRKSTWRIGRFAQWLLILVHVYRPRVASRSCLEAQLSTARPPYPARHTTTTCQTHGARSIFVYWFYSINSGNSFVFLLIHIDASQFQQRDCVV